MPTDLTYDDAISHLDDQAFPHAAEALRKHRDSLKPPELPAEIWGLWHAGKMRWKSLTGAPLWFTSRECASEWLRLNAFAPGWQPVLLSSPAPAPVNVEGILERLKSQHLARHLAADARSTIGHYHRGAAEALADAINAIAAARKEAAK